MILKPTSFLLGLRGGALGFQRYDYNIDPAYQYSTAKWMYTLPQTMSPPYRINRTLSAPYRNKKNGLINGYNGVWIDVDMHPAMQIALEPYLSKLQITRSVPLTKPSEAVRDYEKVSPLIADVNAKLIWLAKVIQLGALHKKIDDVLLLWKREEQQFVHNGSSTLQRLPLCLVVSLLFATTRVNSPEWKPIFDMCLKNKWNVTPYFPVKLWELILGTAGNLNDENSVMMILEEMIDVQIDFDIVNSSSLIKAINCVENIKIYDFIKKFLFSLSEEKIERLAATYVKLRARMINKKLNIPFKDNEKMFYHVLWHANIRSPRKFTPRQLYFNYKPNFSYVSKSIASKNVEDIVKEKVAKWKEEGLVPDDYEYDGVIHDYTENWKKVMKHEHWAKMPKILRDKKYGYSGEY